MKQVIAVIRPFLAQKVLDNLKHTPVEAMNVTEVKGYGRQKSYLDRYAKNEYSLAFLPKVEISLWVDDPHVSEIVQRINEVARCGRMGDGKILIFPVLAAIDIAQADKIVALSLAPTQDEPATLQVRKKGTTTGSKRAKGDKP